MISKRVLSIILSAVICASVSASPKVIPFRIFKGLMIIQAKVWGQSGNYIFDTGIPDMILNTQHFDPPSRRESSGHYGVAHIKMYLNDLTLWGDAELVDLELIENGKRMTIHGMLGLHALREYEVVVDYRNQEIQLYQLERKGAQQEVMESAETGETLDLQWLEHIPYVSARVNGRDLLMGLDTGAEITTVSEKLLPSIAPKGSDHELKFLVLLGSASTPTLDIVSTNVQVGSFALPEVATGFISMHHLNELSGPKIDGLLGLNFLRHFKIRLNFKKKKMYLRKVDQEEQLAGSPVPKRNYNNEQRIRNNGQQ